MIFGQMRKIETLFSYEMIWINIEWCSTYRGNKKPTLSEQFKSNARFFEMEKPEKKEEKEKKIS